MSTPVQDPVHRQNSCSNLHDKVRNVSKSLEEAKKELKIAQDLAKDDWTVALLRAGHLLYLLKATSVTALNVMAQFGPKNVATAACIGLASTKVADQAARYQKKPGKGGNVLDMASVGLELSECITKNKGGKILINSKKDMVDLMSDTKKYNENELNQIQFTSKLVVRSATRTFDAATKYGGKNYIAVANTLIKELDSLVDAFTEIERDVDNIESIREQDFRTKLRAIETYERLLAKAVRQMQRCEMEMNSEAPGLM